MRKLTRWLVLVGASLAVGAAPPPKPAAPASPLPWIQNDYPRAVALARERKVPIFVEAWAPW